MRCRRFRPRPTFSLAGCLPLALALGLAVGCNRGPAVAPVSGKVLYNGQPLPYGSVLFQPAKGQPAGGAIEADGSFQLSTFAEHDGAIVGPHKVAVSCYSSQRPSEKNKKVAGEASAGDLLIPAKYTYIDQSALTAEVPPDGASDLLFELTGPKRTFPQ